MLEKSPQLMRGPLGGRRGTLRGRVPPLPENEVVAELTAFLEGKRNLFELEAALVERVDFEHPGQIGVIRIHGPLPLVPLKKDQLLATLGRVLKGAWTVSEATRWAAAVLVLDCFDLEAPGAAQDLVSETVWDLASYGANDQLTPDRLRELIDQLLDAAA
jgi:hypothetical protein